MKRSLSLIPLLALLAACDNEIDNQQIIKQSQYKAVNPVPVVRDFIANNQNHKVIVAILDSGIDYNHPYLANNIHFDLDEAGQPIGAGWDYAGNDSWPAPYIARTDFFNEELDQAAREKSFVTFNAQKKLLIENPELKTIFPLERNIEEEQEEGFIHGTHVAGLASYDSPEIGLRGYRVVSMNRLTTEEKKDPNAVYKRFGEILIESLNRSILEGANVINMSLGINYTKDTAAENKQFFTSFQQRLIEVAENNPDVIFVVAAGNDGKWIDGSSSTTVPCFIPRKNVICVSALSEDMTLTSFTNVVLSEDITTIYAWGEKVLSTMPTNACHSDKLKFNTITNGDKARQEIIKIGKEDCAKDQYLKEASGTSMASPIVARKVAKLVAANPGASVDEIKAKLFEVSVPSKFGVLSVMKLPIEKPSWYHTQKSFKNSMLAKNQEWNLTLFSK